MKTSLRDLWIILQSVSNLILKPNTPLWISWKRIWMVLHKKKLMLNVGIWSLVNFSDGFNSVSKPGKKTSFTEKLLERELYRTEKALFRRKKIDKQEWKLKLLKLRRSSMKNTRMRLKLLLNGSKNKACKLMMSTTRRMMMKIRKMKIRS